MTSHYWELKKKKMLPPSRLSYLSLKQLLDVAHRDSEWNTSVPLYLFSNMFWEPG